MDQLGFVLARSPGRLCQRSGIGIIFEGYRHVESPSKGPFILALNASFSFPLRQDSPVLIDIADRTFVPPISMAAIIGSI